MPHYDYECKCGYQEEVFHKMSETPTVKCKDCKKKMAKLISGGAGVLFTGDGVYQSGYKNKYK